LQLPIFGPRIHQLTLQAFHLHNSCAVGDVVARREAAQMHFYVPNQSAVACCCVGDGGCKAGRGHGSRRAYLHSMRGISCRHVRLQLVCCQSRLSQLSLQDLHLRIWHCPAVRTSNTTLDNCASMLLLGRCQPRACDSAGRMDPSALPPASCGQYQLPPCHPAAPCL
jgi:hypothetical protein